MQLTVFAYSLYHGITNVPGRLRKSSVRYSSTFIPFAQAVAATEYIIALASAPFTEVENSQLRLPTHIGRIAFSARLLSIGISPDSRNWHRYLFSFFAYCTAFARFEPPAGYTVSSHA